MGLFGLISMALMQLFVNLVEKMQPQYCVIKKKIDILLITISILADYVIIKIRQ
jgi:hypothetical protein